MDIDCQAGPKVIPVGYEASAVLRGLPAWKPGQEYVVRLFSKINRTEDTRSAVTADADGVLRCPLQFRSRGEYVLEVKAKGEERVLLAKRFFAVRNEWLGLRPYRGDLHSHTTGSDGRDAPSAMAVRARAAGQDFFAITDHDRHAPGAQAIPEAAALGLKLLIVPGEEVTIRDNGGHILSLGASGGVSALGRTPPCEAEVARILRDELSTRALVVPLTPEQYAHAVWTMRKIRQLGGLAVLAHPFWDGTSGRYYPPRALVEQLLRDGLYDGIELLGGSPTVEGNRLAVAQYVEEALRGRRMPITGGSDAHGVGELANAYATLIFTETLSTASVLAAVRDHRSVACDHKTGREAAMYGPFEWVEYAYFLHREFFPLHDRICQLEGQLCERMLQDAPPDYRDALTTLRGELDRLYRTFWWSP